MIELPKASPKILVIGDLILDHYLWGSCNRISPEAPVQVVNVDKENTVLGGAGNVINNLKSLGVKVDIISVIGKCDTSNKLRELLSNIDVSTNFLISQDDRVTSKKSRIIASQQQVIRFDCETNSDINNHSKNSIINIYEKIVKEYDIILLSDYGKGVLSSSLTKLLISIADNNSKKVLVDPKGNNYLKYKGAFLITPNKKEATEATNIEITDNKSLTKALLKLKKICNLSTSLITLSEEGVAIYDNELRIHPTVAREVYDVTGAGDTILASLGYVLSFNNNIDEAVQFANLASGVVVGKIGSATASINEITEYESRLKKTSSIQQIKTWDEISSIVFESKLNRKKIVFTNGCFDILHSGHIKYLEKSKSFGDILILGLNSDESVRKIKGKNRPINSENDRAYILASLEAIDYVVIFNQETPLDLINLIKPDILVKGGDYKHKKIVGNESVKEVKIVEFYEGYSTSNTIKRIKEK